MYLAEEGFFNFLLSTSLFELNFSEIAELTAEEDGVVVLLFLVGLGFAPVFLRIVDVGFAKVVVAEMVEFDCVVWLFFGERNYFVVLKSDDFLVDDIEFILEFFLLGVAALVETDELVK